MHYLLLNNQYTAIVCSRGGVWTAWPPKHPPFSLNCDLLIMVLSKEVHPTSRVGKWFICPFD